jgi:hypothetical protein
MMAVIAEQDKRITAMLALNEKLSDTLAEVNQDAATASAQSQTQIADLRQQLDQFTAAQTLAAVDPQAPAPPAPSTGLGNASQQQGPSVGGRVGRWAKRAIPVAAMAAYATSGAPQQNWEAIKQASAAIWKPINEGLVQPGIQAGQEILHGAGRLGNEYLVQPAVAAGHAVAGAATDVARFAIDQGQFAGGPAHTTVAVAAGAIAAAAMTSDGRRVMGAVGRGVGTAVMATAKAIRHPAQTVANLFNKLRSNPESPAAQASPREAQQVASAVVAETPTGTPTTVENTEQVTLRLAKDEALAKAGGPQHAAVETGTEGEATVPNLGEAERTGASTGTHHRPEVGK